jgi:RNA polymerase sigma-70 factor (ECF subfamily)
MVPILPQPASDLAEPHQRSSEPARTPTRGRVARNVVFADPRVFEAFDLPGQISSGEFRQPR